MPKEKTSKARVIKTEEKKEGILNSLKLNESYVSLILGIAVVLFSAALFFSFSRNSRKADSVKTDTSSDKVGKTSSAENKTFYIVKEGDDLWNISEKIYKSGYNWVDIAKANKLENPDLLIAGTKLTLPSSEAKIVKEDIKAPTKDIAAAAIEKNGSSFSTYTVVNGDFLWEIAVKNYGDGFRWVQIAKANGISNPDYIYSGTILKLPR